MLMNEYIFDMAFWNIFEWQDKSSEIVKQKQIC